MSRSGKVHRADHNGKPLCGKGGASPEVTNENDEVTCGLCHKSMLGSWGIPLPEGVSPNTGGRKKGNRCLTVDPERVAALRSGHGSFQAESGITVHKSGIFVKAKLDKKWGSYDICCLDKLSLLRWLRRNSDREPNPTNEDIIGTVLGHGKLSDIDLSEPCPTCGRKMNE